MAVATSVVEFQEAFAFFDGDRDGRINAPECIEVLRALGVSVTASESAQLIAQVEKSYPGGGLLSFANFIKFYSAHVEPRIATALEYSGSVEDALREFESLCRQRNDDVLHINELVLLLTRVGDRIDNGALLQLLKALRPNAPAAQQLQSGGWAVQGPGSQVVLLPSPSKLGLGLGAAGRHGARGQSGQDGKGQDREAPPPVSIGELVHKVMLEPSS